MANVLNSFEQPDRNRDNPLNLDGTFNINDTDDDPFFYLTDFQFSANIADLSTAETIYIPVPVAGNIAQINTIIDAAIATSDVILTTTINGTPVTGGAVTIPFSGSAAGDKNDVTPSANNAVVAGDYLSITTDAASTGASRCFITFSIETDV